MIPAHCSRNLVATQGIYFAVPSTFSKHGVYFLRCATNSKEELLNSFLFIHALKKIWIMVICHHYVGLVTGFHAIN